MPPRVSYRGNGKWSSWEDEDTGKIYSCVDQYFVSQDGSTFKVKYKFRPYFYAATKVSFSEGYLNTPVIEFSHGEAEPFLMQFLFPGVLFLFI